MRTLATQLESVLTAPVVQKATQEVKRMSLREQREFDKAAALGGVGNLGRLSYLCELARTKRTPRKIEAAQQAMLEFLQRHSANSSKHITSVQFAQLSSYYKLTVEVATQPVWADAEAMYEYVAELPLKRVVTANNH